jgi:glycerol dehydrogenase
MHVAELGSQPLLIADESVRKLGRRPADVGKEELETVAKAATAHGETIHNMPFPVTPAMVVDAMVAADSYSRAYQQESGQQPAAASH